MGTGAVSPTMLNLVLGMLARWDAGAGDAMALDDDSVDRRDRADGAIDAAPRSEPRRSDAPSPGLLAPMREAARGDAATRNVIEGEALPPAASDDVATRFAPHLPASFSLMGLRAPQPDAPAAGSTPDRDEPGLDGEVPSASAPPGAAVRRPDAPPQPARAAAGGDDRRGEAAPTSSGHPSASPDPIEPSRGSAAGPTGRVPDMSTSPSPDGSVPDVRADASGAEADAAAPGEPPRPVTTPAGLRPHEPVPGGTAPTLATAAQSLSVPDAPPAAVAPRRSGVEERDAEVAADRAAARDDGRVVVAEARPDPLALPVAARDRLADVDWLTMAAGAPAGAAADGQVERAGVIASFILNAAMIPGWPPPRPFEMPPAAALLDRLLSGPNGVPGEDDMLDYFAGPGAEAGLLARMRARLSDLSRSRRLRVLVGLAALWTTIEALIDALEGELLLLSDTLGGEDEDEDEMRRTLTA